MLSRVKRCVVLAADLGAVRGAIQPDVGSGVMAWLRAANATSWARSTMCGTSSFSDTIPGWPPYPHHFPCSSGEAGIPRGRGRLVTEAVRPATQWMRVVSRASARRIAGRRVVRLRAKHRLARPRWRYGRHTCNRNGFTMVGAGAFGDLPWLDAQGGPPARDAPLIVWSGLNIYLAPAASPAPLQGVGLQVSSWSHQAWCRLTRTRLRRPLPPA